MTSEPIQPGDFATSVCTKCKKPTKHVVVSLAGGIPSKVQCTMCKGNHNYRSPESQKSGATQRTRAPQKTAEMLQWEKESPAWDEKRASTYSMTGTFKTGELLNHHVFGLGVVRKKCGAGRIQVMFQAGDKTLVCG